MKINILTTFPEMFVPLQVSMIGRAIENGIISLNIINFRDYSEDKRSRTDDYSFGGGQGMVQLAQPIFSALDSIDAKGKKCIYMSPRGKKLSADKILEFSKEEEITILCGHYEGVDQRVLDYYNMEEVSIGDYVLTGGELPAMVLVDSVARLIPGVLASEESAMEESIYSGLLEYPQYTKPRNFRDMEVPEVLVSGNHKLIHLWRFEKSLELTKRVRPDLFEEYVNNHGQLTKDEKKVLEKFII